MSSYFSPWRRCGILGLLKWRPIWCQFFHLVKWTIFASQHKWKLGKFKQSFQVKNSPEDNCNIIVTKERQKEGSFNGQWKQGTWLYILELSTTSVACACKCPWEQWENKYSFSTLSKLYAIKRRLSY